MQQFGKSEKRGEIGVRTPDHPDAMNALTTAESCRSIGLALADA